MASQLKKDNKAVTFIETGLQSKEFREDMTRHQSGEQGLARERGNSYRTKCKWETPQMEENPLKTARHEGWTEKQQTNGLKI